MNTSLTSMIPVGEIAWIAGGCAFLTAWATGTILTSQMCRLSWRLGALDRPDGFLKCHQRPTATLGGVPLFFAIGAGAGVLGGLSYGLPEGALSWLRWSFSYGALIVAGAIILGVGISDDLRRVMPRTKLLFQMLAAMVLIGSGLLIRRCDFFGVFEIPLGPLAVPFTLFWLVGSCNSLNFIDGMDGLASGIGVAISGALALVGFMTGAYVPAVAALAVAGGLLAVLLFNVKPAAIFLGDSGSQLVGLILGTLAIKIATVNGGFMLPCAGLIMSVPIIDAFLSILRRYSESASPATGDHKHIHHCLRRHGMSVTQAAASLWIAGMAAGAMGIYSRMATGVTAGLACLTFVLLELYVGVRLGCLDGGILWERLRQRRAWKATAARPSQSSRQVAELAALWERMKPLFEQMRLDRAILTLEGVGEEGRTNYETYQWVRDNKLVERLLGQQWTKRFALEGDERRIATLRLETAKRQRQDEQRIDWLLKQISDNMRSTTRRTRQEEEAGAN